MNLYTDTDKYICHRFKDRDEWKSKRIYGIGGSDAATLVGHNPYKSNQQLWREKMSRVKVAEIDNDAVRYGIAAEPILRDMFKLHYPEFDVQYVENCILQSKVNPWQLYSPDGLIYDPKTGRKGILEIKTAHIQNAASKSKWKDSVPDHYYIQTLHGLLVTDFDFVIFCAELNSWNAVEIVFRDYTKEESEDDLKWLMAEEKRAWSYYEKGIEPALKINI